MIATSNPSDICQVVNVNSSSTACSNLPSYPISTHAATGGLLNGSPTICGGSTSGGISDSCYVFDKSKNSWKLHCSMKSGRSEHASTLVKDALFITGGHYQSSSSPLASSEYIYANGTVESGPDLPAGRWCHCMVTLHDDRVLILGAEAPGSLYRNVIIYDALDNSFTSGPSMNYNRRCAACTLFESPLHNGRPVVLVAGGYGAGPTSEVYDYTNANNQWQTSIQSHYF